MDQSVTIQGKSLEFPDEHWNAIALGPISTQYPNSEGRNICKKISQSLFDRTHNSRGSKMFQQQRKRASKFTTVSYGTQPPENNGNSDLEDEVSSPELYDINYSSESESLNDGPSLEKDFEENFDSLKKKKDQQYTTLAMDVSSMRGKGAKIFTKRQERMKNYVITDENRRQSRKELVNQHGQNVLLHQAPLITQKYPPQSQTLGYNTDMEDESSRPRPPQIHYFSDFEGMPTDTQRRSLSSRNQKIWKTNLNETELLLDMKNGPEKRYSFTKLGRHHMKIQNSTKWHPPSSPLTPAFGSVDDSCERLNLSGNHILPTAMKTSINTQQPPKQMWARVTFNPQKLNVQKNQSEPVIAYPCAKTSSSRHTAASTFTPYSCFKSATPELNPSQTQIQNIPTKSVSEKLSMGNLLTAIPPKFNGSTGNENSNDKNVEELQPMIYDKNRPIHDENLSNAVKREPQNNDGRSSCSSQANLNCTFPSCHFTANQISTEDKLSKDLSSSPASFNPREPNKNQSLLHGAWQPAELSSLVASQMPQLDNKLFACLKVLDPAKSVCSPKSSTKFEPSPTLNALVKLENTSRSSAGSLTPRNYQIDVEDSTSQMSEEKFPSLARDFCDVQSLTSTKSRARETLQLAQPLGAVADAMKGKGAKMFEKQQKRMQKYTKETSRDDYPELKNDNCGNIHPDFVSKPAPNGFLQSSDGLEDCNDVRNGMQKVIGELQRKSNSGKAIPSSETKRQGRDPLYYQQHLFYRPPSAADFVTLAKNSESCSPSPKSSPIFFSPLFGQDKSNPVSPSETASASPLYDQTPATTSTLSLSSRKSAGPKTTPKPTRMVIERRGSKSANPEEADSNQSLADNELLIDASVDNGKDFDLR